MFPYQKTIISQTCMLIWSGRGGCVDKAFYQTFAVVGGDYRITVEG